MTQRANDISLRDVFVKFKEWWRYLLSKWLFIVVGGLLGGAIGLAYALNQKPVYTATLTFVLEEEGGNNLGNLGGLAAMAGLNLGTSGGGLFKGDNIMELYKSRSIITKSLLSRSSGNDTLLIHRYLVFNKMFDKWDDKPHLQNLDFSIPEEKFTLQHDSVLGEIVTDINKNYLKVSKPDNSLSFISVETKSNNEAFAKDFTEVIVRNVNDFYIQTRTRKSLDNLSILQLQTDSIRRELNSAIGQVASALDANPNPNYARQVLRVPSSRRQVDVQANQAILSELVKNLELAKITIRKETPLIQVVDEPRLPLKKDKLSVVKAIVLGGILFGFLVCVYFMIRKYIAEVMESQ